MTDASTLQSVLSDAELILATRAGDAEAFGELYRRHVDSARAAASSLTRSRADRDDVVAEAFSRVLSILQRGGGPDVSFRPYLLTSVRNCFYDKTRRDKREEATDDTEDSDDHVSLPMLDSSASAEDRAMVAKAFASLPERWQLVLWHTEVEGRSPAEVGRCWRWRRTPSQRSPIAPARVCAPRICKSTCSSRSISAAASVRPASVPMSATGSPVANASESTTTSSTATVAPGWSPSCAMPTCTCAPC